MNTVIYFTCASLAWFATFNLCKWLLTDADRKEVKS